MPHLFYFLILLIQSKSLIEQFDAVSSARDQAHCHQAWALVSGHWPLAIERIPWIFV